MSHILPENFRIFKCRLDLEMMLIKDSQNARMTKFNKIKNQLAQIKTNQ